MTHIEEDFETTIANLFHVMDDELDAGATTTSDRFVSATMSESAGGVTEQSLFDDDIKGKSIRTWEDFVREVRIRISSVENPNDPLVYQGDLITEATNAFAITQGLGSIALGLGNLGPYTPLSGAKAFGQTNQEFMLEIFANAFSHWASDLNYTSVTTLNEFFDDFAVFLSARTGVQDATGGITQLYPVDLMSYRDIYFSFFPAATAGEFDTAMVSFYNDTVASEGYFLPSHFMKEWYESVETQFLAVNIVATGVCRKISEDTGSDQVRILFEVFDLITDMLGVLQKVAAQQATRLKYYANEQKAYTDLIGKIPRITPGKVDTAGLQGSGQTSAVGRLNEINQSFTEKLRSYRSIVADESKQHQTSVNQSNEVVNQQSSLSTEILQKVSSMLQAIFR